MIALDANNSNHVSGNRQIEAELGQPDRKMRLRHARLSDRGVARVVQRWAERAGLDSARFAGHSLRAGLATSAAAGGVSERAIMNQTGHRSLAMVRRYIRDGELLRDDNAARGAGL